MARTNAQMGAKVGPRLAELTAQAVASTQSKLLGTKHALATQIWQTFFRQMSAEARTAAAPLADKIISGSSPEAHAILRAILQPQGEWESLASAGMFAFSFAYSPLSALLNNLLQFPVADALRTMGPMTYLPYTTTAQLVAHGLYSLPLGQYEAEGQGIAKDRFNDLVDVNQAYPPLAEMRQMLNRGLIGEDPALFVLARLGIPAQYHRMLLDLRNQVLSPEIAADLVLRGWMDMKAGEAEAALSGIDAGRFKLLWEGTGEPPGLMQLLEAYRRNIIDKERLVHGIRESRVRDEWNDVVEALRYTPPGYGAVLEGAVKGHLTTAQATKMIAEAGIDPTNYDWMFKATGNPLSPGEMLDLWNRGQADQAEVEQSMRQGHLADYYIPFALKLRQKWLTGMEVLTAQQVGAMTAPEAQAYLAKLGYSPQDAHIYAQAGIRYKLDQVIKDTMAAIEDEYQLGGITTAEATSMLGDLQFSSSEAAMILQSVDYKRELSVRNSLLTRVQNMYVKRQIDKAAAQQALLQQKVPVSMATQLLEMWTLAREETVLIPSEAQIRDAYKYGIMDQGSATAYLMQLGYSEYSAWVLLSVTMHAPLPNEPAGAPPPPPPATA